MKGTSTENGWVLDLGAGTGDLSLTLRKVHSHTPIVAIDISKEMLSIATSKPKSETISWVIADVRHLPIADSKIEKTVSAFLVRNVPEIEVLLREQLRVLQPRGAMTCLDTTPPRKTLPAFLQRFYFSTIVPFLGRIFANDSKAYQYLAHSTISFLTIDQVSQYMDEAGFTDITAETMSFGVVAIHSARKP